SLLKKDGTRAKPGGDEWTKEKSRLSAGPSRRSLQFELPILIGILPGILAGVLALTARILLLLARLFTTALLLAGLLTGVLVLLARVMVLAGHKGIHDLT